MNLFEPVGDHGRKLLRDNLLGDDDIIGAELAGLEPGGSEVTTGNDPNVWIQRARLPRRFERGRLVRNGNDEHRGMVDAGVPEHLRIGHISRDNRDAAALAPLAGRGIELNHAILQTA